MTEVTKGRKMGKQSKARQKLALLREVKNHRRFYDLLLQDTDFRDLVMGAVVVDFHPIVDYVVENKEIDLFGEIKKVSLTLPFEKLFMEFKYDGGYKGILLEQSEEILIATYIAHSFKYKSTNWWATWEVSLDEYGHYVNDVMHHMDYLNAEEKNITKGTIIATFMIAEFALGLINCRNIELIEHEPDEKLSAIHNKRYRFPLTKFKTIGIKSFGREYENESQPKEYQGLMPLHLRRGNFATYTDDAPLFGKYTGTFWRPATVVGEEKRGIVVKDYKVIPPEDE